MKIDELVRYICKKYPLPKELSKARITKIVYLADWEACRRQGEQLTDIKWFFHNFGPYVDDVVNSARESEYLEIVETQNFYGEKKEVIAVKDDSPMPEVDKFAAEIVLSVLEKTKNMYWNDFIAYVYSTDPIAESERYSVLNLKNFAKKRLMVAA
jgi:hypothetical protein